MLRPNDAMLSRQLGRNTQTFAREIGRMDTPEARHPYLRQLLAVIDEARPEWAEAEHRADLFRHLVGRLCGPMVTDDEIDAAVRARDAERALATVDLNAVPEPEGTSERNAASEAESTPERGDVAEPVETAADLETQEAAANGALDDEARAPSASEDVA